METPGRDGDPREALGTWGRTGTLGRRADPGEGQGSQGGMGTPESDPRKDRDFREGCGPSEEMGTRKGWGCQEGMGTPERQGDPGEGWRYQGMGEGRAIPAPLPHATGWLLPTPLEASPARHRAMPPHVGHSAGAGLGQHLGPITPPPPQPLCFSTFLPNSQAPRVQGSSNPGVAPPRSPHAKWDTAA